MYVSAFAFVSEAENGGFGFTALLLGSFKLLSDFSSNAIAIHQVSARLGPVHNIRRLLTSADLNHHFLFVSCLQCLEPDLWAGTSADSPAILEGWEVERVMKLLDSADAFVRKRVSRWVLFIMLSQTDSSQTIDILHRVDPSIVSAYFAQAIQAIPSTLTVKERNERITRLLEVIEIQSVEDGESYARQLKELFLAVDDDAIPERQPVLEVVVEKVLLYINKGIHLTSIFSLSS